METPRVQWMDPGQNFVCRFFHFMRSSGSKIDRNQPFIYFRSIYIPLSVDFNCIFRILSHL